MGELMIKGSCTNENLDLFALGTPLDIMKLVTKKIMQDMLWMEFSLQLWCGCPSSLPILHFHQNLSFGNKSRVGHFDTHSNFSQ